MKIDKIIFASNDSHFLDFWKIQSKVCKEILNIQPVLFHITDYESDFYDDGFGLVKKVKKIDFIRTGALAAIGRMFFTKYFPDEVCLISDIDMLIIDKDYLENSIKNVDDDSLVIYVSDAYDKKREEALEYHNREYFPPNMEQLYPYHLNAAKGKIFGEILGTDCTFKEYIDRHQGLGNKTLFWGVDECYFSDAVNKYEDKINVVKLTRGYESPWKCDKRLERHRFPVKLKWESEISAQMEDGIYNIDDIINKKYVEINCPRPYEEYKEEIDKVVDLVIKNQKNVELGLYELGYKNNTDKILYHRYDRIYDKFLNSFKKEKVKLFEIGCGSEYASFKMWKEYFPNGMIYSMDIDEELETDRGVVYKGDQTNIEDLKRMVKTIGECDIIIDDGSHIPQHQISTFEYLFENMLKNGGIYIIEDIECSYWDPKKSLYGYEIGDENIISYFESLPHKINSEFSNYKNDKLISSITFYKNCIILTKMTLEEMEENKREYRFKEML